MLLLCSCGGPHVGPGSDNGDDDKTSFRYDPLKGAFLNVVVAPTHSKIGDRIQVEVELEGVNENGALIKVRFPNNFEYEDDSSLLIVEEDSANIGPAVGPATHNGMTYIVYLVSQESLPENNRGTIALTLRARKALDSGKIEVDDDIHTPGAAPSNEFNERKPLFSAEDSTNVKID